MKKNEFVVLKIGDREIQLPVVTGTEGEKAFDITQLRKQTGFITWTAAMRRQVRSFWLTVPTR